MTSRRIATRYPVIEPLASRWSPRSFQGPVEDWKITSALEAARISPSAYNEQPWRFVLARRDAEPEVWERLFACLSAGNRRWASTTPVLILAVAKRYVEGKGPDHPYAHSGYDLGQAVMSFTVQAHHLGLFVHQMAGFDPERARKDFQIPPGYDPLTIVAVGYVGAPCVLPTDLQAREVRERTRRNLEEMVYGITWGNPSPLVNDRRHR